MQARGYPPESNAHGSGDEGKTQNDGRMLRREHVILAQTSSKGEQVPDQFGGGEENRVSSGFTAREIPCLHEPRPSEAEVQRDEVSRLSRADDADTSSCNPWDHGRSRP